MDLQNFMEMVFWIFSYDRLRKLVKDRKKN